MYQYRPHSPFEELEKLDLKDANMYDYFKIDIFSQLNIGLLHGKMKSEEKERTRKEAFELVNRDPDLSMPEHKILKTILNRAVLGVKPKLYTLPIPLPSF